MHCGIHVVTIQGKHQLALCVEVALVVGAVLCTPCIVSHATEVLNSNALSRSFHVYCTLQFSDVLSLYTHKVIRQSTTVHSRSHSQPQTIDRVPTMWEDRISSHTKTHVDTE